MCGIVGYIGHRPAVPLLLEGLSCLEYRGYDSAGIAFVQANKIHTVKAAGKLANLEEKVATQHSFNAMYGIGHTRWATHGKPTEENAHPHADNAQTLTIVHNGIIENYEQLRDKLKSKGYFFLSETDTEVFSNLLSFHYSEKKDILTALQCTMQEVEGAYAVVIIHKDYPDQIFAVRKSSPLILGVGQGEYFLASDIPAFLPYTRSAVFLNDGEIAKLSSNSWEVLSSTDLKAITKEITTITWDLQAAQKSGYKHFMLKEIYEQPQVIHNCLAGRISKDMKVLLPELDSLDIPKQIRIVACGTSYHAGLWGMHLIEKLCKIPVQVEIASEFRYREPLLPEGTVVFALSQSGETADTLAGLRLAKENNLQTIGLCNVVGSTLSREADRIVYTQAGPEMSVASTKAMCSQLVVLFLFALYYGQRKNTLSAKEVSDYITDLENIAQTLEEALPKFHADAKHFAKKYAHAKSCFYLGRGLSFPLALEGALKLKEISYIHAEGYAAGEMKHGPIALIDKDFPTFAIATQDSLFAKTKSNILEVQARNGKILALVNDKNDIDTEDTWLIPKAKDALSSFYILPALQFFAYEVADSLGKDVDQPRNLAKSVTVE